MLKLRDNLFQLDAKMLESIISVKLISFFRAFWAQHHFHLRRSTYAPNSNQADFTARNAFGQIDSDFFCLFFVSSAKSQRQTDGWVSAEKK